MNQIAKPHQVKLNLKPRASAQILLMLENDFTLEGKFFRITIDGKGCEGFKYACGFDDQKENDIIYTTFEQTLQKEITIILDAFTAHYFREGEIDYDFDPDHKNEGFIITNSNEKKFYGKFFKDDSLTPKF